MAAQLAVGRALTLRWRALFGGDGSRSWRRVVMLGAGAPGNFIFTIVAVLAIGLTAGFPRSRFRIVETLPGQPADGRLAPGDVLVSIEGKPIEYPFRVVSAGFAR